MRTPQTGIVRHISRRTRGHRALLLASVLVCVCLVLSGCFLPRAQAATDVPTSSISFIDSAGNAYPGTTYPVKDNGDITSGGIPLNLFITPVAEGEVSKNYTVTLTASVTPASNPPHATLYVPPFSANAYGEHTVTSSTSNGISTVKIVWPKYTASSTESIPVYLRWNMGSSTDSYATATPEGTKVTISGTYSSDEQPTATPMSSRNVTGQLLHPKIEMNTGGSSTQYGGAPVQSGSGYAISTTDTSPVVFRFNPSTYLADGSAWDANNERPFSSYTLVDTLPTYQGSDGQTHTAILSANSKAEGWKTSADGKTASLTVTSPTSKFLYYDIQNRTIALEFPGLALNGATAENAKASVTNTIHVEMPAANSNDKTIISSPNASCAVDIVTNEYPLKPGSVYFDLLSGQKISQEGAHSDPESTWRMIYTSSLGAPQTLFDMSAKIPQNDPRMKLTDVSGIFVDGRGKSAPSSVTVVATATDGSTDTYTVQLDSTGKQIGTLSLDSTKVYTQISIRPPQDYQFTTGMQLSADFQTKFRSPQSITYDATDPQKNLLPLDGEYTTTLPDQDNRKASETFSSSHSLEITPSPKEQLIIDTQGLNNPITATSPNCVSYGTNDMICPQMLIYKVAAHLDQNKDYGKEFRILAPLPKRLPVF